MKEKRFFIVGLLTLLAALLAGLFQGFGLLDSWQEKLYDRFFIAKEAPNDIVIVGIDEETLKALGGWPLSRQAYATALSHLGAPRAVGIDVGFYDPSPLGAGDDAAFSAALQRGVAPTVLAGQYDDRGGKFLSPLPIFTSVAEVGYVNVILGDGVVRTLKPLTGDTKSMSAALLPEGGDMPSILRIDWHGPAKTFLTIPFIDVYEDRVPASVFEGKTVLIGATAKDLHDILITPVGTLAGVEVHANTLATLGAGKFFTDVATPLVLALIFLVAGAAAATVLLVSRLAPLIGLLAFELVVINLASIALFAGHIRIPSLSLSLAFILSAALTFIYQYLHESREKQKIRQMFQYYLPPAVIDELAESPERLALGGEEKELTILFSDIRGFTTLSEGLSPAELAKLMNEYLTAMTDAVMDTGGLVDKYIGDAVMAFWGAPVTTPTHAKAACSGALGMLSALRELNARLRERGAREIAIGIGISTGPVVVGNMGSSKRFNYTVMGDEVNFASRLEGLTKAYGVSCIIGETTAKRLSGDPTFALRELDLVLVKGKKEPRTIYELSTPLTGAKREQYEHFTRGREAYVRGDWAAAKDSFETALSLGEDGPSATYLARVKELAIKNPKNWNGIWEFEHK